MSNHLHSKPTPLATFCDHLTAKFGVLQPTGEILQSLYGLGGPWGILPKWPKELLEMKTASGKGRSKSRWSPIRWFRPTRRLPSHKSVLSDAVAAYAFHNYERKLGKMATRTHGWLFKRNLVWLCRILGSVGAAPHLSLATLTYQGLEMAVVACAVRRGGIRNEADLPAFDEQASVGDLLALHLLLEDWIDESVPEKQRNQSNCARAIGGLRGSAALHWPRVVLLPAEQDAQASGQPCRDLPLEWLVRKSPLTQLIYFDIFGSLPPAWSVHTLLQSDNRDSSRALWVSHLGRSIHAAAVSPSRSHEIQTAVAEDLAELRRAKKTRQSQLTAAELLNRSMVQRVQTERIQRIEMLGGLFRERTPDLIGLQYRFLEMFARNVVRRSMETARSCWITAVRADAFTAAEPFFWGRKSTHLNEFFRQFFGNDPDQLKRSGLSLNGLCDALRVLLDPPSMPDSSEDGRATVDNVAEALGLLPDVIRRLRTRFHSSDFGELTPAPSPHNGRGPGLSKLTSGWLVDTLQTLATPNPTITEE